MGKHTISTKQHYNITVHTIPPPEKIYEYEEKIKSICKNEQVDDLCTTYLIDLEGLNDVVDVGYVKYLFFRHMKNIVDYLAKNNIILYNIEQNINLILDDIVKGNVSESYYENTIEIYENISNWFEADIYGVINQAIRLNNIKLLYYLYYTEEMKIDDYVCYALRE